MSKYDPQYDIFLIDIPVNFVVENENGGEYRILYPTIISEDDGEKIYKYRVPNNDPTKIHGVIHEYGDLMSVSVWNSVIYNNYISNVFDVQSSIMGALKQFAPSEIPNLDKYILDDNELSSNQQAFNKALDYIDAKLISSSYLRKYSYDSVYSSSKSLMFNISDVSSVISNINIGDNSVSNYISSYTSTIQNIQSQINSSISSFSNKIDGLASSIYNYCLSIIPNNISNYINSNDVIKSVELMLSSSLPNVLNGIKYNKANYILEQLNLVEVVADYFTSTYVNTLNLYKDIYLGGFEKYAGKRIGMTNLVDIYATRQTLKTIRDFRVSATERISNALNAFFIENLKSSTDLLKTFSEFMLTLYVENTRAITISGRDYIEAVKVQIGSLSDNNKLYINLHSIVSESLRDFLKVFSSNVNANVQKYSIAFSFLSDIYKNLSVVSSTLADRSLTLDVSMLSDYIKLFFSIAQIRAQSHQNKYKYGLDISSFLMNASTQYMSNVLNYYGYRLDRALELMSHFAGIPNTINRGLSKFEQWMAPVSLALNTVTSVGSMILPFL